MKDLNDKTIVITGASSGIGASAAARFAERGARLALLARGKKNSTPSPNRSAPAEPRC